MNFGLSLCIQGTLAQLIHIKQSQRFIPVYTGNMYPTTKPYIVTSVYPCVYREHLQGETDEVERRGLSLCIQGT